MFQLLLVLSVMLPANPWSAHDWQPLKDRYAVCQAESLSALEYYECAARWSELAEHPLYNA